MTSSEYEEYVTNIVRQFGFCKNANISNNRKFKGKRQPGEYEIDIAVEMRFTEIIYLLIIIECKHWNRPVDRPVIQSLAQTKDAISAHKAIAVASSGFSKEAESVAEAHNIGLWWIDPDGASSQKARSVSSKPFPDIFDARACLDHTYFIYNQLRSQLFSAVGIDKSQINYKIKALTGEVYTHITSYEDWRRVDSLKPLALWEESSIVEIIKLRNYVYGKTSSWPIKETLIAVATDSYESFRDLLLK
jgi:hypothetical protein